MLLFLDFWNFKNPFPSKESIELLTKDKLDVLNSIKLEIDKGNIIIHPLYADYFNYKSDITGYMQSLLASLCYYGRRKYYYEKIFKLWEYNNTLLQLHS